MPVVNADIATRLEKIADLLDIEGANPFRIRAYRRAARLVSELPRDVNAMLDSGENLDDLPGIGPDLAGKIASLARGERLPLLDTLEHEMPPGIVALLTVPGLGPKRVHLLHDALGIDTIAGLSAALKEDKLRSVPGFGIGLETKIRKAIANGAGIVPRIQLATAEQTALPLLADLRQADGVLRAEVAGSYRRRRETVGDLDFVAAAEAGGPVIERFVHYEDAAEIVERGPTRATIRLRNGMQVDLRVVPEESYGAALCYFTGSKAHSIALRRIAIDQGLKLNEYGLFRNSHRLAGRTENEIYVRLGLGFVPPELREDQGEIEAARQKKLPRLISVQDIKGDLHTHTNATDGKADLPALVQAAQAKGYTYVAITDHSRRLAIAHGLDAKRLARQAEEIDQINAGLAGFTVLKSVEVDILEDGTLDLPDEVLCQLDLVVGAIHSHFSLPLRQQTERILRAMDNRHFNILAHPGGRLINKRAPYAVDMERLMRGAVERGCFLELNSQPDRLDLTDTNCRLAKSLGLKMAISTDAHAEVELDFMRYGVDQAKRGWLEAGDILNTRPWNELATLVQQRR